MNELIAANQACQLPEPTIWTIKKRQTMVNACRELATFHYKSNPSIRYLYDKKGFDPNSINGEGDLQNIPPIGVSAMKHYLLTSREDDHAVLKLTSSGTRGQKTQVWFDQKSLDRVQRMLDVLLDQEGLVSSTPTNYLLFSYDPEEAKNLGTAFTAKNQTRFAPANKIEYALKKGRDGEWKFDKRRILQILTDYQDEGLPVRIKGMPAFIFEFISFLREQGQKIQLAPQSAVLTGGGWKAAEDKMVSREYFREMISENFNVNPEKIRDGYGMAEHSAPYFECKNHRMHVPAFNHLIIRDPETMKPVPNGDIGLLELITPYNTMMPNLALLSTDWASLHPTPCPCGANSPTFQLHGRAGLSKHAGCALTAENIIKRSQS